MTLTTGTFSGLPDLYDVRVFSNHLTHIPVGTIELFGSRTTYVYLQYNNISRIEVGAITGDVMICFVFVFPYVMSR